MIPEADGCDFSAIPGGTGATDVGNYHAGVKMVTMQGGVFGLRPPRVPSSRRSGHRSPRGSSECTVRRRRLQCRADDRLSALGLPYAAEAPPLTSGAPIGPAAAGTAPGRSRPLAPDHGPGRPGRPGRPGGPGRPGRPGRPVRAALKAGPGRRCRGRCGGRGPRPSSTPSSGCRTAHSTCRGTARTGTRGTGGHGRSRRGRAPRPG